MDLSAEAESEIALPRSLCFIQALKCLGDAYLHL